MSNQTDSAGNQTEQAPAQVPNSEGGTGQPNSPGMSAEQFVQFLNNPAVDEALRQKYQSEKDRGVNKAQTVAQEARDEVARIAQYLGVNDPGKIEQARNQKQLDEALSWVSQQRNQVPDQKTPGSVPDLASVRQSILTQAGLEKAPSGFDDLLASLDWSNGVNATLKAVAWVQQNKSNVPSPSPAESPPPSGGGARSDDLTVNYTNEMLAARGKPSQIRAIKAKYIELGLDVNNIGFNV